MRTAPLFLVAFSLLLAFGSPSAHAGTKPGVGKTMNLPFVPPTDNNLPYWSDPYNAKRYSVRLTTGGILLNKSIYASGPITTYRLQFLRPNAPTLDYVVNESSGSPKRSIEKFFDTATVGRAYLVTLSCESSLTGDNVALQVYNERDSSNATTSAWANACIPVSMEQQTGFADGKMTDNQ